MLVRGFLESFVIGKFVVYNKTSKSSMAHFMAGKQFGFSVHPRTAL
jgi:hypothetical protein